MTENKIRYKDGVYTSVQVIANGVEEVLTCCPEIEAAKAIANEISLRLAGITGVVTSIFDGKHKKGSKHYSGEAFDFRINHYRKNGKLDTVLINRIVAALKKELGKDFDVVLHKGSHIHIEFDPK